MFKNQTVILFCVLCLLVALWSHSQAQSLLLVQDARTGEPLPYANVCFEDLQNHNKEYRVSNEKGEIPYDIQAKTLVAVSYVGYESLLDTLYPQKSNKIIIQLKPSSVEMKEFVFTAQYAPVKKDQSIYKIDVIDFHQIHEKGASRLSDLLATETSFRIANDAALGSKLSLQGLGGEHIKILIDGVPVIGRMDGNIDISQLNLYNVDHIEIIEGPMSVIYGSNALAGAINIITRENTHKRLSLSTDAYYESAGVYNFNTLVSGGNKKNYYQLALSRNFFDGFDLDPETRSQLWDPKRQYNADFYFLKNLNNSKIKFSSSYFHELIQDRGDLIAPYFETAFDHYFTTQRMTGKLEWSGKMNHNRFFNLLFSPSWYARYKQTWFKDLTTLSKKLTPNYSDHDTTQFYLWLMRGTFSQSRPSSHLEFQLGYDINLEEGKGKRLLNGKQFLGDYAVFLSTKYSPLNNLSIQPGIRYAYNTLFKTPLIYSFNIRYSTPRKLNIRASYARGFRAPSLKEMYLYFVDINHNIQGNRNLQPENSHHLNLSVIKSISQENHFLELEGRLFYNNISKVITLASQGGTLYSYVNLSRYMTHGAEASLTYKLHPRFSAKASYTLTGKYYQLEEEPNAAPHYYYNSDIGFQSRYKNLKYNFFFTIYYKFNGRLPQIVQDDNTLSVSFLKEYHIMDITLGKYFLEDQLFVSTGVKNLFNNINIQTTGNPAGAGIHSGGDGTSPVGWGRSFILKMSYYLNRY